MRGTTYPVCRSIMVSATYMKNIGYDVLIHNRCIDFTNAETVIDSFNPEVAIIYVTPTASIEDAKQLSASLKRRGVIVVWGEVVASAISEVLVERKIADFVITGETEFKLQSLATEIRGNKNYELIPGLTFFKDNVVYSTDNRNDTNLNIIPSIDWDLIDVEKCFRNFPHCKKMLYMYTSRGCPYKCTYCYNTMFYNSEHRKRPIEFVLNEVKYLERKYGLDGVNFSDELLLLSNEEIKKIEKFRSDNDLHFVWGGETRADIYNKEALKEMYKAGCRWLLLGLETGSNETRKKINKPMDPKKIRCFVNLCTEIGISTFGSFIIGFPGETIKNLKETVDFALSLDLDAFLFNYYVLVPKTPLGEETIATFNLNISIHFFN